MGRFCHYHRKRVLLYHSNDKNKSLSQENRPCKTGNVWPLSYFLQPLNLNWYHPISKEWQTTIIQHRFPLLHNHCTHCLNSPILNFCLTICRKNSSRHVGVINWECKFKSLLGIYYLGKIFLQVMNLKLANYHYISLHMFYIGRSLQSVASFINLLIKGQRQRGHALRGFTNRGLCKIRLHVGLF